MRTIRYSASYRKRAANYLVEQARGAEKRGKPLLAYWSYQMAGMLLRQLRVEEKAKHQKKSESSQKKLLP